MKCFRFLLILSMALLARFGNASHDNQVIIMRTIGSPFDFGIVISASRLANAGTNAIGEVHASLPLFYQGDLQDSKQVLVSDGSLELRSNGNVQLKLTNGIVGINTIDTIIGLYRVIKNAITFSRASAEFVDKYSQWKQEDYRNDIVEKFRKVDPMLSYNSFNQNFLCAFYVPEDIQKIILSTYEQYQFSEFQAFIKTLPLYKSHIEQLHKRVMDEEANAPGWLAVASGWRKPTSWTSYPGYEHQSFPDVVAMLHADMTKEATPTPIAVNSGSHFVGMRAIALQQAPVPAHNSCQEDKDLTQAVFKTVQEQQVSEDRPLEERRIIIRECVQDSIAYIRENMSVQRYDLETGKINERERVRWQMREHALEQSKQDDFRFEIIEYSFSQHAVDLLRDSCIDNLVFGDFDNGILQESIVSRVVSLDGSAIQHCLQRELITILDHTAIERYAHVQNQSVKLLTDTIGGMAHIATEYNQLGDIKKTVLLTDFCWAILDIGMGIGEGAVDGVYNIAHMIVNPVDTAVDTLHGVGVVARSVGSVLYEICGITKDCIVDRDTGMDRIKRAHHNISAITAKLKNKIKKMSRREIARAGTGMLVEALLTKKCMSTMHYLYKGAQTQMVAIAQKIEQGVAPQLAYTAGGFEVSFAAEAADSLLMSCKGDGLKPVRSLTKAVKRAKKDIGGAGKAVNKGGGASTVEASSKKNWTSHGYRHVPQKRLTWPMIVKGTKYGLAKYKPDINIEALERFAWENGLACVNKKGLKVIKFDYIIGATEGIETCYMRVGMSANTIHGHPITQREYNRYLKIFK